MEGVTNRYEISLECPWCPQGTLLEHVNGSRSKFEARAVMVCAGCGTEFVLYVQLLGRPNPRRVTPAKAESLIATRRARNGDSTLTSASA